MASSGSLYSYVARGLGRPAGVVFQDGYQVRHLTPLPSVPPLAREEPLRSAEDVRA